MKPTERFIAALKGQNVDRIPVVPKIWVDYGARVTETDIKYVITDPLTALRVIALAGVKYGFDAVRQFYFPVKQIIEKDGNMYEINKKGQNIGKIDINGGLATHLNNDEDYMIQDPVMIAYCHSWITKQPLVNNIKDARSIAVPGPDVFDSLGWAKNQKIVMDEFKDKISFIGDLDTATMSFYITFRGIENAMLDLITDPKLVHAVMEKGVEVSISRGKYLLDQGMSVLRLNDSTGNMSLISPEQWKEFIFPHIKTVCDELHNYNQNALIYCHICGNVLPIVNLLVEAGLDCIAPLDPLGGSTVEQVRQRVGNSVSLMGGVNTLILFNGTVKQVKEEAFKCIEQSGPSGGFVLGSGCVVPRGCPEENIQALVDAVIEYSNK